MKGESGKKQKRSKNPAFGSVEQLNYTYTRNISGTQKLIVVGRRRASF